MDDESRLRDYLTDVLHELLDAAQGAKADYAAKRTQAGEDQAQFDAGRAMGYYETLSLLVSQLDAFGIRRILVGVPEDLDVDKLML